MSSVLPFRSYRWGNLPRAACYISEQWRAALLTHKGHGGSSCSTSREQQTQSRHSATSLVRPSSVSTDHSDIQCCRSLKCIFHFTSQVWTLSGFSRGILELIPSVFIMRKSEWHLLTGRRCCGYHLIATRIFLSFPIAVVISGIRWLTSWSQTPKAEVIILCGVTAFVCLHFMPCAFDVALHDECGAQPSVKCTSYTIPFICVLNPTAFKTSPDLNVSVKNEDKLHYCSDL